MKNKHSNQRGFFRVDAHVPFISRLVPAEDKEDLFSDILSIDSVPALTRAPLKKVDLSGGGVSFDTTEHYVHGDIIEIHMVLNKVHEGALLVYGEAVRVDMISRNLYRVAVRFVSLDERIRDLIIKFVFIREREIIAERRVGWI